MERRKRLILHKRMDHIQTRRMVELQGLLLRLQWLHRMQYCVGVWVVVAEMHVDMVEVDSVRGCGRGSGRGCC